jgi:hypothetical protein
VFVARVSHNSSPNSPVVHKCQNQCCELAWDSYAGFYCSKILGLRPGLKIFHVAQACKSVESQTC